MEKREKVQQPETSGNPVANFFNKKQAEPTATTQTEKPVAENAVSNFFLKKKEKSGTPASSDGLEQSDTSVSESTSPTPEPKPLLEKSANQNQRLTPFNSLTLSSDQLQDLFDAPKHLNENPNKKIDPDKFLAQDIDAHAPNIFSNIAKATGQVMPFADKMSDFDKKQIAEETKLNVLNNPTEMSKYISQRVKDLRKGIAGLETEKLKYLDIDAEQGVKSVTDQQAYDKTNNKIAEKQAYINQLKNNVAEVAADKILSETNFKNFLPGDVGRKIVKISDPELDLQFQQSEKSGTLPGGRRAELEKLGIDAARRFLNKNPDIPNAKEAKDFLNDTESSFDLRNSELTAARVRSKLGEYFYNLGGVQDKSGVFGYSEKNLKDALADPKLILTPTERQIAETVVLPTERRIWGTDIPGSGFARSFRNAVEKSAVGTVKSVLDITGSRDESDAAMDNLSVPENTRYAEVENRSWVSRRLDGIGDLTGQVAMMALASKGLGSTLKGATAARLLASVGAEEGVLGRLAIKGANTVLSQENMGLFINSYLTSYDNYKQSATASMPGDLKAQDHYAKSMAFIEGLSEKMFNDQKVLKAFTGELAPTVRDITKRFISNEITSDIAKRELSSGIARYAKQFGKEYSESTVKEGIEEASVDVADAAGQSIYGGTEFNLAKTGQQALNTFITTAINSPLVAGLAAHGSAKQSKQEFSFYKSALSNMAANPGEYLKHVDDLEVNKEITTDQANEKRKLIKSASQLLGELPASRLVQPTEENDLAIPQQVPFTSPETTAFLVHGLNQQVLQEKIDNTTNPVIQADLKKQLTRSQNIQKGIYDGSVSIDDNLQEVAQTPEEAEKLDIKEPSAPIVQGTPEVISEPVELLPAVTSTVGADEISQPIELDVNGPTNFEQKADLQPDDASGNTIGDAVLSKLNISRENRTEDGRVKGGNVGWKIRMNVKDTDTGDSFYGKEKNDQYESSSKKLIDFLNNYFGTSQSYPTDSNGVKAQNKDGKTIWKYLAGGEVGQSDFTLYLGSKDDVNKFIQDVKEKSPELLDLITKGNIGDDTNIDNTFKGRFEGDEIGFGGYHTPTGLNKVFGKDNFEFDVDGEKVKVEYKGDKLSDIKLTVQGKQYSGVFDKRLKEDFPSVYDNLRNAIAEQVYGGYFSGSELGLVDLPNEVPVTDSKAFATVNNNTKEFVTKSGKQKVIRDGDGKLKVLNVEDETPVSSKMERKALREYSVAYDYTTGEKAPEPDENAGYASEGELLSDMVAQSSSPSELAAIFTDQAPSLPPLSVREQFIADFGIKTTEKSYAEFGDRNNLDSAKKKAYFRSNSSSLDVIAKEISDHYEVEVTPQDLIDFMDRFPNGVYQSQQESVTTVAKEAADKFFELTGIHLTPEVAAIAIEQEATKIDIINSQLLNDSYENERALTDAYFESIQNNAPLASESQSQNDTSDRKVGQENNAAKPPVETSREAATITEAGKKLADKIRKLKSSQTQANANIFGLAVGVYDGLIEAIATAVENGAKLADAIQSGIASLSVEDQADLSEEEFIDSLLGLSEEENTSSNTNSTTQNTQEDKTDKRRFTANQVMNDKTILPEVRSAIRKSVDYAVQTNAMTVAEAELMTEEHSPDEIYDIVVNNVDVAPAVRVVLGMALIKKYNELASRSITPDEKNTLIDKTISIANFVSEKLGTEAGQMIQAFSLYARLSPDAQLRSARKEAKSEGTRQRDKARKNVAEIAAKLKAVNTEAANEVVGSNEAKKATKEASEKKQKRIKTKIEKIQDQRASIIKKYKNDKGKNLYAAVGLTNEGIEFVGNIAATYIKEGIANAQLLVEKIKAHLVDISGKPTTAEVDADVVRLATEAYDKAVQKDERKSERLINKGLENDDQKIGDIVKKHFTEVEATKRSLVTKLVDDAGLTEPEASELATKLQNAFDRIATRKKEKLLEVEKKRFNRIKNQLAGAKKVVAKTLQDDIIRYTNLGAFSDIDMMDKLADLLGTGALTPEQGQEIERLANAIQTSPEGSPQREATEDLLTYRQKIKGDKFGEVLQSIWYANVLSGFGTHLKNIVSTFFNGFASFAVLATRDPKSIPFLMMGGGRGIWRGFTTEAAYTLKTGRTPIHVAKVETPNLLERKTFAGGILNPLNYLKYVGRMMAAEDVVQFQGLKEMKATQLAYKEAKSLGYVNPFSKEVWRKVDEILLNTKEILVEAYTQASDEGLSGRAKKRRVAELMELSRPIKMQEESYGFAAHGTFNHDTEGTLGALTDLVSKSLDIQVGGLRPLRWVVPFTRIITNVVNTNLDYFGVGAIRAWRGKRGFESFRDNPTIKNKYHEMTKDERIDAVVKSALGISITAALYAMTKIKDDDDKPIIEITGAGPSDFKKLAQLKQEGWAPYSIKVGGTYYSYALTPLIFNLGALGTVDDHMRYQGGTEMEASDKVALGTMQTMRMIADMSWVGSAAGILGAVSNTNPEQAGKDIQNVLNNTGKGILVPNAFTQIAQRWQTISNTPQKEVKGFMDNLIQDIPVARNSLNNKINALGDPIVRDVDYIYSNINQDPVWKTLLDKKAWVAPVNKKTLIFHDGDGLERPATDDEYYKFAKKRGEKIKEGIKDFMQHGVSVETDNGEEQKPISELSTKQFQKALSSLSRSISKDVKQEMQAEIEE